MSGRKARQSRQALARRRAATPCDCAAEPWDGMVCHGPECAFLVWCADTTEAGFCSQCGYRLQRRMGYDPHMGCIVKIARCPHGCSNSHMWIHPEDATQAERDYCGLVLTERPTAATATDAIDPDGGETTE